MAKPPKRMSAARRKPNTAKTSKAGHATKQAQRVATAPSRPTTTTPKPARGPDALRERHQRLEGDDQTLRERTGHLEAQLEELKKANEELSRERVALRERAGVIEKRYTELVERTARSVASPAQASDAELQSLRQRLDRSRREREEASKTKRFWMVCPKCGGKLEEVEHEGVKVERCRSCAGIYLDKGELEAIVPAKGESSFLQSLRGLFS